MEDLLSMTKIMFNNKFDHFYEIAIFNFENNLLVLTRLHVEH